MSYLKLEFKFQITIPKFEGEALKKYITNQHAHIDIIIMFFLQNKLIGQFCICFVD